MTMFKLVNGVSVEMSAQEEAAILAERAANTPTLASKIGEALRKIDADTDAIYADVLGNRAEEYRTAEADAQAYKDAGYIGAVPASVTSWATAKGWTATQAADDILTVAVGWRTAQAAIRSNRLTRKEQARAANSAAELSAALSAWAGFVAIIRSQLGL